MTFLEWLGLSANGEPLKVGDPAPRASAPDEQGREVRLDEVYAGGMTLVYFYPKASTPGCTAQACSLRDGFHELQARGVQIIGVSADGPTAQLRFREKQRLPFRLLADERREVIRAFRVPLLFGVPRRQAFLIKDGRIVWRDLSASTREQSADVLRFLEGK
jgi:peroxiredoxin Q/BCP